MEQDKRLISFELPTFQVIEEFIDYKIKALKPEPDKVPIDEILDTEGVMLLFNVSKSTVDNWRKKGIIPFLKIGKGKNATVRFIKSDIYKVLEENRIEIV